MRSVALALGFVASAGQLASVAHMLLVPHGVCVEHGALVHVARATTRTTHAEHSAGSEYRDAGASFESDDEHCQFDALRRAAYVVAQAGSVTLAVHGPARPPALGACDTVAPSVALLLLSPKCSPPPARA